MVLHSHISKKRFPFSKVSDDNLILTLNGKNTEFVNVAQKRILEKTQFLQQINLVAEKEQDVNITRYFNSNELKEPQTKNISSKYFISTYHLCHITAQNFIPF